MNRRTFLTQCALGSAGLASFVQGCQPSAQRDSALAADPDGPAAHSAVEADPQAPPAIDRNPPPSFETATFALG